MNTLSKEFLNLTLDGSNQLGQSIGILAQTIYENGVNNIHDTQSKSDILIVGISGAPGAGKSVYAQSVVLKTLVEMMIKQVVIEAQSRLRGINMSQNVSLRRGKVIGQNKQINKIEFSTPMLQRVLIV